MRFHKLQGTAGIVDHRLDLAAVAHDRCVGQLAGISPLPESRHALELEPRKRAPEGLALAQDRQPGQPGLEALEAELLEQPHILRDRKSPLGVVIGAVFGR